MLGQPSLSSTQKALMMGGTSLFAYKQQSRDDGAGATVVTIDEPPQLHFPRQSQLVALSVDVFCDGESDGTMTMFIPTWR
jgi:hypothetical protein